MERRAILARLIEVTRAVPPQRCPDQLSITCRDLLAADGTSIMIANPSMARHVLAATDLTAAFLEEVEDTIGDGPSDEAYRSGQPVAVRLAATHAGRTSPDMRCLRSEQSQFDASQCIRARALSVC